jgi:hypothetical protein
MRAWILAEFESQTDLLASCARLRADGRGELDVYSPYPLRGAEAALLLKRSKMPTIALGGGLLGVATAYFLQWWTSSVDFPINVGNRPLHSPLAFVPITFELAILFSALSIFFGLLFTLRLPRPHHPVFECEEFRSASTHSFWLSVETSQRDLDPGVAEQMRAMGARTVAVVDEGAR